jgi:hypothetical protein
MLTTTAAIPAKLVSSLTSDPGSESAAYSAVGGLPKRRRDASQGTHTSAVAGLHAAVSEAEAQLRDKLLRARATITFMKREEAHLRTQLNHLRSDSDLRESTSRFEGSITGAVEAYRDCEARALAVAESTWYRGEAGQPVREALRHLASGYSKEHRKLTR